MGPKFRFAALISCICLCSLPLLARPTRSISREGTTSLAPLRSSHASSREIATLHRQRRRTTSTRTGPRRHVDAARSTRVVRHTSRHTPERSSRTAHLQVHHVTQTTGPATARVAAREATATRVHAWMQRDANDDAHQREQAAAQAIAAANSTANQAGTKDAEADNSSIVDNSVADNSSDDESGDIAPPLKSIEQEAATPVILPSLYDRRGRLIMPAPLRGSHAILVHQNEMADRDGLNRVRDQADLLRLRREKKLVPIPVSRDLSVDARLPADRRYSRPWTADFLTGMADSYYARFHTPLRVDSAVRTIATQEHLLRINGNAAPITGDTASPHLTGEAVDIGKRGLTRVQIAWMRAYLIPFIHQGKIDVEEEFQQACFHISVYKSYMQPPSHANFAADSRHASSSSSLASAVE